MRIAIVSGDDVASADSAQLAAALAAQGQDVITYVRQPSRPRPRKGVKQDYRVVSARVGPDEVASDRELLPFVGDWAAALERAWSSTRPDMVHAHGWLGGLAAQLAARRRRLPTVQTFQGLEATSHVGDTERGRVEPLLARNATWVTGESSTDVEALSKLRRTRERVSVLAGGVDAERFTPVGPALARTDLHRVLCLAPNPLASNGFDIVLRTLPRVPDAEVVIAETDATDSRHDEARSGLKQLAADLRVSDRVRFTGPVAGDQLPKLLRSADVVACTPREPPRAAPVLQAMASGVAVVALPVGVLTDVVVHSVTGFVLSPNKPSELVATLRNLPAQKFQCQSMGSAGRNRALSRFTWDRLAHESLNIYRQLGSPYSRPAAPQLARVQ